TDELDGLEHAVVYLPDTIHYFVAKRTDQFDHGRWQPSHWDVDEGEGDDGVAENPTKPMVPVVPFVNRPDVDRMGFGEFEDVIDIQDRINQGTLDRLVTG